MGPVSEGDRSLKKSMKADGKKLQQEEYNTTGLGSSAFSDFTEIDGQKITENAYRAQRNGITVGAVEGDATMHQRTQYKF